MSEFVDCPGPSECCGAGFAFDPVCALRTYPELEPLIDGLALYFNHGIRPGHFLTAVLTNDLQEAFSHASDRSRAALPQLMQLLYNHAPSVAFGSKARFDEWRENIHADQLKAIGAKEGP